MTDIFLYQGEANPNDVKLRDPGAGVTVSVISAGGIASAEAFGAATFSSHVAIFDDGGIASGEAFGAGAVSSHVAVLAAGGIASAEAFGAPAVTSVGVPSTLVGGGRGRVPFAFAPYTPFIVPHRDKVIGAGGIESAEAFGSPRVVSYRERARRRREELIAA